MKVADFSYDLPEELIAIHPPAERGTSRLLVVDRAHNSIQDSNYADVAQFLEAGDLLVLNDSRVIKARLQTTKVNGAERELVILEKHAQDNDWHRHKVMYRGRLKAGEQLKVAQATITVEDILGNGLAIVSSSHDLLELAETYGQVPLPPYMRRQATAADTERYQTLWARQQGSVAAPTASLNMTESTLESLCAKGVQIVYLTLHVGLGTFMPIRGDKLEEHHMHQEYFEIPASTVKAIQATKQAGGRVVALGTTVARTLEYAAEDLQKPARSLSGEADIFIYPGYQFKIMDSLLTNFHAPKSTVLMLTAAFAGWPLLQKAYSHAVEQQYRFLSYGDSMLIL